MENALKFFTLIFAIIFSTGFAQETTGNNAGNSSGTSLEEIYGDIMNALPADVVERIDTLSAAKKSDVNTPSIKSVSTDNEAKQIRSSETYQNLPADVKARVEKMIDEVDKRRNDKQMRFKNSRQNAK
ncbi:MAG: hypothetical protein GF398_16030 [Chitinivibrionales bacterium]|nr:hypothetical protein [Chitinivibrionales bacterium]